jgi:transcription termination factor NusB
MAKTTKTAPKVLPSVKEETLNQIIVAQKEKIEALTEYGKKLKKQIKNEKELIEDNCQELIESFAVETLNAERLNQKVLILSVISALLVGIIIGMSI